MSNRADWIAWILHFILGLPVGAFIGYFLISRSEGGRYSTSHKPSWLSNDLILPYLIGTALLGAGIASLYGDKLWLSHNYKVIPPDGVQHSSKSKLCSYGSIAIGVALIVIPVIIQITRSI